MPTPAELEQGELLRRRLRLAQLAACAFALTAAGFAFLFLGGYWGGLVGAAGALVCALLCGGLHTRCAAYYAPLLERALRAEFQRFRAGEQNSLRIDRLNYTGLCKSGEVCRCYKSFHASYRGFPFSWSDLYYFSRVGLTNRFDHTRFRGIWLTVDRPITFKHPVIALRRGVGNRKRLFSGGEQVHEVRLDNRDFCRQFAVFSSDERWTAYLLDPELCDKLMLLQELCGGKLMAGFVENQVHIACAQRTRGTVVPLFGDMDVFLSRFYEEQLDWTRTVLDTLWPARGA